MDSQSPIADSQVTACPNDSDGDGDCHKCARWGGCAAFQAMQSKQLTPEAERKMKEAFDDLD